MSSLENLKQIEQQVQDTLASLDSHKAILEYKAEVFGKKSPLKAALSGVKDLSPEEKATIGKYSNDMKKSLQEAFLMREAVVKNAEIEKKLKEEFEDMTIMPNGDFSPHIHPINRCIRDLVQVFTQMGFSIFTTNEIATEYENFDALNIPASHPARDMQDTFWLEGEGNVLATQTSSRQNHLLKTQPLPLRAIVLGHVFRNEELDATHEIMFDQVEGLVVGEDISMAHLKYTLKTMLSGIFEREVHIRMRPGFFPFVEPGVEVDFSCPFCEESEGVCRVCKGSTWIEFMGAGLVHPNVLKEGNVNPDQYTGFAFGFGLTRLAMIRYGIKEIRNFNSANIDFLKQF